MLSNSIKSNMHTPFRAKPPALKNYLCYSDTPLNKNIILAEYLLNLNYDIVTSNT